MFDIIIPAYNAHQTIWKTLFSLSIQKASRLLDVCIINDNSNEDYQKEILFFQQLNCFNSIIEISNLENMGVGYSRNKGLQATKNNNNKWFIFLDADDYLYSPYSISNIYDTIQNQPNLAIIHGECIEEQSPSIEMPFSYNILTAQNNQIYFHGNCYNRQIIENCGITIPNTRCNEDIAFCLALYHILDDSQRTFLKEPITCIGWNSNSLTRSDISTRVSYKINNCNEFMDCYLAHLHTFKQLQKKLSKTGKIPTVWNSYNFIDKYFSMISIYFYKEKNDRPVECADLAKMIFALYFRDIVLPIYKNNPLLMKNYQPKDSCKMWIPERNFDIIKLGKEMLSNFNQEKFNYLSQIYLTNQGYKEESYA